MKQMLQLSLLIFVLSGGSFNTAQGQNLGILGDAQFYLKFSYASAPEVTRFASEFSDATTNSISMAAMIHQSLEIGAYLGSETLSATSGTGTMFGLSVYYYPLRKAYNNSFNIGFGASFGGLLCNGSLIYGGCVDHIKGNESSLSAVAAYTYGQELVRITPSAKLGLHRSGWRIESEELDDSGSTIFPFASFMTTLKVGSPGGMGLAITPQYLVSAKARQFELALAIIIE